MLGRCNVTEGFDCPGISARRYSGLVNSEPGRFILVNGPSGSGKSTFARELGEALGLAVAELDALFHLPGWEEPGREEFLAKIRTWMDSHPEGWVLDGNYHGRAKDLLFGRADTVIWLKLPFRVVYPRLVKRTLRRAWTRELLWGTNRESWRQTLMSRESMLVWGVRYWRPHHRRTRAALRDAPPGMGVVVLRSTQEVRAYLAAARRRSGVRPGPGGAEADNPAG